MNERISDTGKTKGFSNGVIAMLCGAFFVGMVGMAYAAVPLYQLFCQVTGYGGTTQRAETQYSGRILDENVTVRFDANTSAGLGWDFQPVQRDVTMKIGETVQIAYRAKNLTSSPSWGRSSFNVTPQIAGGYFMKVECFCFTDTKLEPGEEIEMPVVFYVDPDVVDLPEMKNIRTITLSYTFYPVDAPSPEAKSVSLPKTGNNFWG
ncbi:MAG: cytochrome c oxidase assembly protein [Rhizobiaceae bacterium]|nr:cytochrome c oxidase assembly protein [Rhizobiaceae bacterium]